MSRKVVRAKTGNSYWQVKAAPVAQLKTVVAVNKRGTRIEVTSNRMPNLAADTVLFVPTKLSTSKAVQNKRIRLRELNETLDIIQA